MAKDTFYFQHDYEPTGDPKLQALIGEYGATGYGLFWRLVEMLHSDELHKLPKKEYIYIAIAKQMSTSVEQVKAVVTFCCDCCELFMQDDTHFWSERVLRNISKREDIKEKRSIAGKKSAELRNNPTSVQQVLTSVEQNPTKEKKVNENKEVQTPIFFNPLEQTIKQSLIELRPQLNEEVALKEARDMLNKYPSPSQSLIEKWAGNIRITERIVKLRHPQTAALVLMPESEWEIKKHNTGLMFEGYDN